MTVSYKNNVQYRFLAAILVTILFFLFGCVGGKGFHMEIATGNDSTQRIQELAEKQMADDLPAKDLPEITGDEYERMGDALLSQKKLYLAYIQYEKSLKLNPENLRVEYKKGLALLIGGKNEDALKQFRMVLDKVSDHALSYEGIGRALFQQKKYSEAEAYFKRAIEIDSTIWKSHNFLGNIYDYQRRYDKAALEYISALVVRPDKGFLYNNLGVSYFSAGKLEEAVEALQEAIALKYKNSKVYNNLGLALANLGKYFEALEAFKKGGGEARAQNNLGCIYLRQGKFKKAILCFEKAIEIESSYYTRASENLKRARALSGNL